MIKLIDQRHYPEVVAIATPQVNAGFSVPKGILTGFAAFENDVMVAYLLLWPEAEGTYSIPSLATREGHHGKGYMQALFQRVYEALPSSTLWLEVHQDNVRAQKFYEQQGFKFEQSSALYRDGTKAWLGTRIP